MQVKDYVTLKSKSKSLIKKADAVPQTRDDNGNIVDAGNKEHFYMETKSYDPLTGDELTPIKDIVDVKSLEKSKTRLLSEKTKIEKEVAVIEAIITDIKAI